MSLRARPYLAFLGLSVLLFIAATAGSDVVARMSAGGQGFAKAVTEHAHYAFLQPTGSAMLLVPFLLLGWIAASTVKKTNFDAGLGVFLLGVLLLGFMYFSAYQDSQVFMRDKKWTAAALAVGLLPFKSVLPLLACLGFRWWVVRKKGERGADSARPPAGP